MAYISFQPSGFFKPLKYSYASPPNAITGVGFAPNGLVIKSLSGTSGGNNWYAGNTVTGTTKSLRWNDSAAEETSSDSVTAYDSDGFTLGADSGTGNVNMTGTNYVSYNWKAATTSGKPTTDETLTPSAYAYSAAQGTSIIKYVGTGSTGLINHGLGVAPQLIIIKNMTVGDDWLVYHPQGSGVGYSLVLNTTAAKASASWDCNVTANTFQVNGTSSTGTSQSGQTYIAYCYANIKGYQRMGTYVGNASDLDGTFVYTGFRPAFLMTKKYNGTGNWIAVDSARNPYNEQNMFQVEANVSSAEYNSPRCDLLSNGFQCRATGSDANGSGDNYIYMAFAEFPFVSSNSKAGTAR